MSKLVPTSTQPDAPAQPDTEAAPVDLATATAQLSASRHEAAALREALDAALARERLLAHELQHQVRNMFAVTRSIFRRTRDTDVSKDEFADHFQGRLDAIARYQAGIAGLRPGGMDLEDMVRGELLEVRCQDGPNCRIAGPAVRLPRETAEVIGLALHELATNSVKFGALYHDGRLSVEWTLADAPGGPVVDLRWKETGVPMLAEAPRPQGFGQDLIERALPYQIGASTRFEFKPGGLECSIALPLPLADQG